VIWSAVGQETESELFSNNDAVAWFFVNGYNTLAYLLSQTSFYDDNLWPTWGYNTLSFPSTAIQFKEWYLGEYANITVDESQGETLEGKWAEFLDTFISRITVALGALDQTGQGSEASLHFWLIHATESFCDYKLKLTNLDTGKEITSES
jgi:hypothetical protein